MFNSKPFQVKTANGEFVTIMAHTQEGAERLYRAASTYIKSKTIN